LQNLIKDVKLNKLYKIEGDNKPLYFVARRKHVINGGTGRLSIEILRNDIPYIIIAETIIFDLQYREAMKLVLDKKEKVKVALRGLLE
jgi:hypothetical protein